MACRGRAAKLWVFLPYGITKVPVCLISHMQRTSCQEALRLLLERMPQIRPQIHRHQHQKQQELNKAAFPKAPPLQVMNDGRADCGTFIWMEAGAKQDHQAFIKLSILPCVTQWLCPVVACCLSSFYHCGPCRMCSPANYEQFNRNTHTHTHTADGGVEYDEHGHPIEHHAI